MLFPFNYLNNSRLEAYCYFKKARISIFFLLPFFLLILPITVLNAHKQISEKGFYILTIPSTDCINCKAMGISIIKEIQTNNPLDSITILTDNEAGAFYLSNNESIFGDFKYTIDKTLSRRLAPEGKSTISFKYKDSIKTVNLIDGLDSLLHLVNWWQNSSKKAHLNFISIDSVYLKLNIFSDYGNSLLKDYSDNLFLFSKISNAGSFLSSTHKNDTVSLLQTYLSKTKYDSLFLELDCAQFANIPQKTIRIITENIGIPISRIHNFSSFANNDYLLFSFFTGSADTVIDSVRHINQRLIQNVNLVVKERKTVSNPLDLSLYNVVLNIDDSIIYKSIKYSSATTTEFNVTGDFVYLPIAKLSNEQTTIDSMFYLAKYALNSSTKKQLPAKILYYPGGNFSQNCLIRSFKDNHPILANTVTKTIDFGENLPTISYAAFSFPELDNDSIDMLYDIFPISEDNIRIIASTKSGKIIIASLINKSKIRDVKIFNLRGEPVLCKFDDEHKVIVVSKDKHFLFTQQYSYN